MANFTVHAQAKNENILSMEKFDGMLKSAECTPNSMTLQFEDDDTFAYAQKTWDWVNGADNHTFLMVAGKGDCGNNPYRIPYLVHSIKYDELANTAFLNATTGAWKDLAKSYELVIGDVPMPGEQGLTKRDVTRSLNLPLAHVFDFKVKAEVDPVTAELECEDCNTSGTIGMELRIKQNVIGLPNTIEYRVQPSGVKAQAKMKLTIASKFKADKQLFLQHGPSIPLLPAAINIEPDIFSFGPFLDVDVGGEIADMQGEISIGTAAKVSLSDSAIMRANLLDPLDSEFSGWVPDLDFETPTLEAKISAVLQFFFMPAIRVRAQALGQGIQSGIELKLPLFDFKIEAVANEDGGVCNDPKKTLGIKVEPSIGTEIKFKAGTTDGKKTPVDITITPVKTFKIGKPEDFCFAFDPDDDNNSKPSTPGPTPNPSPGPSPLSPTKATSLTKASNVPVASCTANNGLKGTCMATSACKDEGGVSEAGHCPGGTDNQVRSVAVRGRNRPLTFVAVLLPAHRCW